MTSNGKLLKMSEKYHVVTLFVIGITSFLVVPSLLLYVTNYSNDVSVSDGHGGYNYVCFNGYKSYTDDVHKKYPEALDGFVPCDYSHDFKIWDNPPALSVEPTVDNIKTIPIMAINPIYLDGTHTIIKNCIFLSTNKKDNGAELEKLYENHCTNGNGWSYYK